jgi:hypothetical protein
VEVLENKSEIISDDDLRIQTELLKAGIEKLLSDIKQIRSAFPFNIEKKLHDEEWVTKQNRQTEQQIEEVLKEKQKYEERISLLKSL